MVLTSSKAALVQAQNLQRVLQLDTQRIEILRGISFDIPHGEWLALTGPSGSGKSTLLGLLAGLDSPDAGQIMIDGVDISRLSESALARLRNQKIGVVFQSFNLIPTLTTQENVEAPLYVHPKRKQARQYACELLERVGLADRLHHQPQQLSGGQQQRVAIARALVTQPQLLVADEPTGNLDSQTGAHILDLFEQLRRELGLTMVIATHDPAVAARADRELHLVDGLLTAL